MTSHVARWRAGGGSSGHVWQGRFKAFPIQKDAHLLAVLRYVERNPLRAGLVERAEDWRWSSLSARGLLSASPVERGRGWAARVNAAESESELDALRRSVRRGAPYGTGAWVQSTAARLGLEASLRPRGRPRKSREE